MEDIVENIVKSLITNITEKQAAIIRPVTCRIYGGRTYRSRLQDVTIERVNVVNRDMWQLRYKWNDVTRYRLLFDKIDDALEHLYYMIDHEWYGVQLHMLHSEYRDNRGEFAGDELLVIVKKLESDETKSFQESSMYGKLMHMATLTRQVLVNTSEDHDNN